MRSSIAPCVALIAVLLAEPAVPGDALGAQAAVAPPAAGVAAPTVRGSNETTGRAVRALKPPVLDGRDDDEVWRRAPAMGDFRQFDPGEDLDAAFPSETKVAYDDHYLYVLVRAFDPHPDSILSLLSRRDVKTPSDQLKIIVDAFHDGRTGVEMAVNPAGVKRDFSIYSDNIEDPSWDGVWDVATHIDDKGWIAEFRVPFSQLRFNAKDVHTFGFGVWRDIARLNERDAWPAYRRSSSTLISQLGTVTGIEGIAPVTRLEVLPYAVTKNVSEPVGSGYRSVTRGTGGLDVKAGLSPNITLDATVNPDFGQVEADPAVLNLSAFEIRFDERRPLFQEGAGLYRCGGVCEGIFYSRRIGRSPQLRSSATDPNFTNISGAAKLTARFANGLAIGVIDAVTERVRGRSGNTIEPQTNYFVLRAVRETDGGRTQLGAMITDTRRRLDAATEPYLRRSGTMAIVQGYRRFAGDEWQVMAYTGYSIVEGSAPAIALTQLSSVHYFQRPDHQERFDPSRTSMAGNAVGLDIARIRGTLRSDTYFRWANAGIEGNDLGFVSLVNDAQIKQQFDLFQRTPNRLFRSASASATLESHWTTAGMPAARSVQLRANGVLPSSWGATVNLSANDLGGVNCVTCARGGPALRQSPKLGLRVEVTPDPRLSVLPYGVFRAGTSDEGRSSYRGGDFGAEVRTSSRFSASLYGSFDHVINDQQWVANYGALGSDTLHYTFARLDQNIFAITARANFTATPSLSFQLYAQPYVTTGAFADWRQLRDAKSPTYDGRFRPYSGGVPAAFNFKQFNSNAVARWEYRPASTLFVVWQQGRQQTDRNLGDFAGVRDVYDLFAAHPDNTLLVKLSWWFNP